MKITKSSKQGISQSLVLSLQRDLYQRNYYVLNEKNTKLILMEEFSSGDNTDGFTVFNSWDEVLRDMNKFESSIAAANRWWSFCPGWMYFNPAFIHQGLKQVFGKLLVQSLDDLLQSDVLSEEKESFNIWARSCEISGETNFLN